LDRQDQEMSHQKHFTLRNVRLRTFLVTTQRIQPLQPTVQHSACYTTSASHPLMCCLRIRILKHTAWATRLFWLAPGGASRADKILINCFAVQPCGRGGYAFLHLGSGSMKCGACYRCVWLAQGCARRRVFLMQRREPPTRFRQNPRRINLKPCGRGHKFFPFADNCGHTEIRLKAAKAEKPNAWINRSGTQDAPGCMTVPLSTRVLP